jgi:xanthine dehydrogenase/oxidase
VILNNKANCRIDTIDTSAANNMPGVVKILFAKDIPGPNSFVPPNIYPEKLFCDDFIDYAGQAIGLVVAETFQEALAAVKKVKVTYKEIKPPILTISDAIKNNSYFPDPPNSDFVYGNAEQAISSSQNKIQNDFSMGTQYHYHMEHHVATCEPYENYYK